MQHALNGIRVIDVTQVMAGPYCAMLLCDLGADVVKVEMPPGGDASRRMAGARGTDSAAFNAVNRGKRGIVVDMKAAAGRDVVLKLAQGADVFLENARPGVMGRMGLGYADLRTVNPGLVYASISGYGQTGPHAGRGGFDLVAQGVAGIMSVTGEAGGPPVKAGIPLTDLGAGLFAAVGILAALQHRARTGEGQHVDTSLVEAGVALSVWEATEFFASGQAPRPMGSAHRMSAPYQALACADGHITIGAANDRLFERLCGLLGHPQWSSDPQFADDTARVANRRALAERIEAVTRLAASGALAGAVRAARRAVRPHQHVRGRIRRRADCGPRDGGGDGPSHAGPPAHAGLPAEDVADAAATRARRAAAGPAHRRGAARSRVCAGRRGRPARGRRRALSAAAGRDDYRLKPRSSCSARSSPSASSSAVTRRPIAPSSTLRMIQVRTPL